MTRKAFEVIDLVSLRLEDLLDEHVRRSDAGALEGTEHLAGKLRHGIGAKVDSKLFLFLNEQQSVIDLVLNPVFILSFGPGPVVEKIMQIDLVSCVDKIFAADSLAVDRPEVVGSSTAAVLHFLIRREIDNKAY